MNNAPEYVIEMLHITKEFPGIKANDDITLQLHRGEIIIETRGLSIRIPSDVDADHIERVLLAAQVNT